MALPGSVVVAAVGGGGGRVPLDSGKIEETMGTVSDEFLRIRPDGEHVVLICPAPRAG